MRVRVRIGTAQLSEENAYPASAIKDSGNPTVQRSLLSHFTVENSL